MSVPPPRVPEGLCSEGREPSVLTASGAGSSKVSGTLSTVNLPATARWLRTVTHPTPRRGKWQSVLGSRRPTLWGQQPISSLPVCRSCFPRKAAAARPQRSAPKACRARCLSAHLACPECGLLRAHAGLWPAPDSQSQTSGGVSQHAGSYFSGRRRTASSTPATTGKR